MTGIERRRGGRGASVSLLWRVFVVDAAIFLAAFGLLAVSPIRIHALAGLTQLAILVLGLLVMLLCDLLLLRHTLSPLRRLAAVMVAVDPLRPGRRAAQEERAGSEVLALARACNGMLDRMETERRESARRALAASEAERLRISRELHDEVGQALTAMLLGLGPLAKRAPVGLSEDLRQVQELARSSLQDVRRIALELRPEALDDLGLVNALLGLCSRVEQQGHLRVRRELEGDLPGCSPEVELVVYRVAQEALTNALRHSQAGQVTVSLSKQDGDVVLVVSDDGVGFPESVSEGSGVAGMRERAMLVGADFQFSSLHGKGVVVKLAVASHRDEL
jgi:two-component system, NarL family, sensor histidine kinase UhpB